MDVEHIQPRFAAQNRPNTLLREIAKFGGLGEIETARQHGTIPVDHESTKFVGSTPAADRCKGQLAPRPLLP
jgi:hypothetical protein